MSSSWDLDNIVRYNPKMTTLLQSHKSDHFENVLSYHVALCMFDNAHNFVSVFPKLLVFQILTQATNLVHISEQNSNLVEFNDVVDMIRFDVLLYKYKKRICGSRYPRALLFQCKSNYHCYYKYQSTMYPYYVETYLTISPDNVFKTLTDYIVLLPDNGDSWIFSLAELLFCALKPEMQTNILYHNFEISNTSRINSKSGQIDTPNKVF